MVRFSAAISAILDYMLLPEQDGKTFTADILHYTSDENLTRNVRLNIRLRISRKLLLKKHTQMRMIGI